MAFLQEYKVLHEQGLEIDHIIYRGQTIWPSTYVEPIDYSIPFYVQNITNTAETVSIKKSSSYGSTVDVYKSDDKTNWSLLGTTSTTALTFTLNPGQKVYLKANATNWYENRITGCSKVGGNTMSLLYGDNFTGNETTFPNNGENQFEELLWGNINLISASNLLLPATTLAASCYKNMFRGCSLLTSAPELPALIMTTSCYLGMFDTCTSLVNAPVLPATTLARGCYESMFYGCSSIVTAPALSCQNLADRCYNGMFSECISLVNPPSLQATVLANDCYWNMFYGCTSLTTAPDLPAPTLVNGCYGYMFIGCTSLNYVKCLATSGFDATMPILGWLDLVSSTGTFVKAAGVTWPEGSSGIPSGWTVQEV